MREFLVEIEMTITLSVDVMASSEKTAAELAKTRSLLVEEALHDFCPFIDKVEVVGVTDLEKY